MWTFEILMIVVILFVCTKLTFIFQPIFTFISTLFFPFLVSTFLYFLLNPVVNTIQRAKIPRTVAILILYVLFAGIVALIIGWLGPVVVRQIDQFINHVPDYMVIIKDLADKTSHTEWFKWIMKQDYLEKISDSMNSEQDFLNKINDILGSTASSLTKNITTGLQTAFSVLTSITITIITVPFILFYMFKDGRKFPEAASRFVPSHYRQEGINILKETATTLGTYIQGQTIVCLFVGTFTFIGYLIIGQPYALLLGIIAGVTNIIPYVGPFIGAAPAVIVALLISPAKALFVILVVVIVQQLDGNIMSPLIIGKKLDLHPLTIIILLLVAGNLAGILGMILAVPVYAVVKTVVVNLYRLWKLRTET
ncbi:putative PurR-regulated permease PerM [Pullulanibacillus pueri]|nr:AI-2E family transporter [Pullulanibacillus pueri]MBM7684022.1 putative PurR-regulated permease PerM [Pullulanibacillus pueri]